MSFLSFWLVGTISGKVLRKLCTFEAEDGVELSLISAKKVVSICGR